MLEVAVSERGDGLARLIWVRRSVVHDFSGDVVDPNLAGHPSPAPKATASALHPPIVASASYLVQSLVACTSRSHDIWH